MNTDAISDPVVGIPPTTHAPLLAVEDLVVEFSTHRGWVRVLDHVSLEIHRGQVTAVVGESGSGKSVTALSVMGLLPQGTARVVSGRVLLDGVDLLQLSPTALGRIQGRRMTMVFQEPMTSLNPAFTIGDQVGESLRHHLGFSRKQAQHRTIELLDEVGIPQPARRLDSYPHEFSGGMRQRVMLAIALACEPELLIADEPTTALDVTVQAQIVELIEELSKQHNTAVMFITHDFGVVAEIADRVTVMYAGHVLEQGDVIELFETPAHPYTQALLDVVGSLEDPGEVIWIEGGPPALHALPPGCRFAPRCPHAQPRCTDQPPPLEPVAIDHLTRCIRHSELDLPGRH
jgi:peptide/nickel transport system ATP-binding protein